MFYGGTPKKENIKRLKNDPPHILVGTPGRTLDLIQGGQLKLDNMKFFILDECDHILKELSK